MWFSSFKDVFAGVHELAEAGKIGDSYYVLKPLSGRPGRASGRAGELGFERILTVLDEATAEKIGGEKKGKVPIIGRRL